MGEYKEIHSYNRQNTDNYGDKVFSFVRWSESEKLIVVSNFEEKVQKFRLKLDEELIKTWQLENGEYKLEDILKPATVKYLVIKDGRAYIDVELESLDSYVLTL